MNLSLSLLLVKPQVSLQSLQFWPEGNFMPWKCIDPGPESHKRHHLSRSNKLRKQSNNLGVRMSSKDFAEKDAQ